MPAGKRSTEIAVASLLAVVLLITGCLPARRSAPPALANVEAYYSQTLAWRKCGGGFECAKLRVPLDYADPGRHRIAISVIRLPAFGDRIGSLLINPGGPGGSGVRYARAARVVIGSALRERFDIVGFDPRGVAESTPVSCLRDEDLDRYLSLDATPDEQAEMDTLVAAARGFAAGCAKRSSRLLPHVGTVNAARDMDVLRAALGDERLTYLGKSYGTVLGAAYAELFPTRVRALVLDGAVDPRLDPLTVNAVQARGFETALQAFASDCVLRPRCPFGDTARDVVSGITALLAHVDQQPLPSSLGDGREVTESWAELGIAYALYQRGTWPTLREALGSALGGDGTSLLRLADEFMDRRPDGRYSNQLAANMAINCVDRPFPRRVEPYAEAARKAAARAPRFGGIVMWSSLPCAFWPVFAGEPARALRATGSRPILVIGTTRDPATPYGWAKQLAAQLTKGVLLTYDGDGHTAYGFGSRCVDNAVDRYLISGTPPAPDTRC